MNRLSLLRRAAPLAALSLLFACAPSAPDKDGGGAATPTPSRTAKPAAAAKIRLGTWNIEHLGSRTMFQNRPDAPPDRTPAQWEQVAAFIAQMQVDVLAVQEIFNPASLQRLLTHLGDDYRFVLGTTGVYGETRISVGFLWNHTRVQLLHCGEMSDFPSKVGDLSVYHRKPVNAAFRVILPDGSKGLDFRAITVHMKASRGTKNENKRSAEARILVDYIHKLAQDSGEDQDIVVLGDFNHTYGAPACQVFTAGDVLQYTRPAQGVALQPTIVWFDEPIDHIALSQNIRAALLPDSYRVHNQLVDWELSGDALTASKAAWRTTYSDHFPVTVELQSGRDLDPDATLTKAGSALQTGAAQGK